jgi:hypothetical protein
MLRGGRYGLSCLISAVFQGLDGAEKGAEAGLVALVIRVEQPLDGRYAVGVSFRLLVSAVVSSVLMLSLSSCRKALSPAGCS